MGMLGIPNTFAWFSAKPANGVLISKTDGRPSFSISIESWTLHDVQEPQSPRALMTTSQLSFNAFIT